MPQVSFLRRADLANIGLSDDDTEAFIEARARHGFDGPEKLLARINTALSAAGREKFKTFIETAPTNTTISPTDGPTAGGGQRLNAMALDMFPLPPMLSNKAYHILISFHRQVEPELFHTKEPFTLSGPNVYQYQDVSFMHLVHLQIRDDDDAVIYERVLFPVRMPALSNSDGAQWQASPALGNNEILRIGKDVTRLNASLVVDTRRRADQPEAKPVPNTRFERRGRFQMIGDPQFRFDGYAMSVALLARAGVERLTGVLDTADGASAASLQGANRDPLMLATLSNFPLRFAEVDFDGSFSVDRDFVPDDGVLGWMWVLTGPDVIVGFQPDKQPQVPVHNILIPLASGATSASTKDVPFDVSEGALLNRPDLFADDPGTSCKPFNNPGRVLGEKRFRTVLRVTQPKVARAGGTPLVFEKQGARPVDFPRRGVDDDNPVDYEADPSQFQAQTVAIGHVLEYAIRYRSNGYSLGDVAYSLTLAPRQKRRILKVDFARREANRRDELTVSDDEVEDIVDRERDYDNAVSSELGEWSKGRSKSSASAAAFGIGGYLSTFVMGGGAVSGKSQSSASQEGGRHASARERQHLSDAIRRYGQSLRSLESTVVSETEQTESVEGVSEVVQNINYTRSLSVIYYEILRHLRVDTEVAAVSECLFVPMPIKPFTDARISRHRKALARRARGWVERSVYRHLDDIQSDFVGSDIPAGSRASHPLTELSGSVWLTLGINMPSEGDEFAEINANTDKVVYEREYLRLWENVFLRFGGLLPFPSPVVARKIVNASDAERERYFQSEIAPHMARKYLDALELRTSQAVLEADFTLVSSYRYGRTLRVDFTVATDGNLSRQQLQNVSFHMRGGLALPPRSYMNLTSVQLRFATAYYSGSVRSDGGTRDMLNSTTGLPDTDGAAVTFRLTSGDTMVLRERLRDGYTELKKTLEANTFRYHKTIWWQMDRDELYTLLDGYAISDEDGRSLAAMAERQPVGIQGNCLVFQIKTDVPVDPQFDSFAALRNHYIQGLPPADPMRISLPTDGLYARAHMDDCIAAEEHDGSFDWVFDNKEPELADFPAGLFDSRRSAPAGLEPTKFPDSIISLQNAPTAPAVSGLSDVLSAVQNGGAFRDLAGLEGTQNNLRAAMAGATSLATSFGSMAQQIKLAELKSDASAGKDIKAVAAANEKAVEKKMMSPEAARENTEAFAKRRAEGLGAQKAKDTASNAKKILDGGEGGTQVTVDSDGAQVVHKEPAKPKLPDPVSRVSVVPIPPNQILFMNFATNSATLRSDHVTALEILAGEVGLELEDVIEIEGHASRAGSDDDNEALGLRRSQALFDRLHALITSIAPNFSPSFISTAGEQGSYRERFSGIEAIKNAPGEGHRNDPVEKAVLFTFQSGTDVTSAPRVIDFFGVKITISGYFIFIGNTIVASTPSKTIKIVDRSKVEVINDNVTNETFTESNRDYSVTAGDNAIVIKLDKANIGQGASLTFNINTSSGKVESVDQSPALASIAHEDWLLQFGGPEIEGARSLASIIEEVATLFTDLTATPQGADPRFGEIMTVSNTIDTTSAAAMDGFVDFLIGKLGLGPVKAILGQVRFGTITFRGDIKVKTDPDVKATGVFSAPGVIIGTQGSAPSAIILNNADYKTSVKLKVSAWDDQTERFSEFAYLDNGFLSSVSALKEGLEALLTLVLPFLPASTIVGPVSDGLDAGLSMLQRFGGTSGVRFKAFSGDAPIAVSNAQAGSTGLELRVIAMASGTIAFRSR
jgi:outer membrane protein OmpA-like peptidoglycan-associated protein